MVDATYQPIFKAGAEAGAKAAVPEAFREGVDYALDNLTRLSVSDYRDADGTLIRRAVELVPKGPRPRRGFEVVPKSAK